MGRRDAPRPHPRHSGRRVKPRTYFDTNVLLAAFVAAHARHGTSLSRLQRCVSGSERGLTSTHGLAELYATLTSIPHQPRIPPSMARRAIDHVRDHFEIVVMTGEAYRKAIDTVESSGVTGGGIYDALHARAAIEAGANGLLTWNPKRFVRLGEEIAILVQEP